MDIVNFLDTNSILDRLEQEWRRNTGLSLNKLWSAVKLEKKTMNYWRIGRHTPDLKSLQHIQEVINAFIKDRKNGYAHE